MIRVLLAFIITSSVALFSQTVGVVNYDAQRSYQGYTLFAPITSKTTYLIDNEGQVVKTWLSSFFPGQAVMLLPNGTLLRTGQPMTQFMAGGGAGGVVEKISWDGTVLWKYEQYGSTFRSHHDVEALPNGNILLLVWESHTREEALAQGRDINRLVENDLWSERIIEVQQTGLTSGEVVWSWSSWDHMIQNIDSNLPNYGIPSEHPEKIDINVGGNRTDWLHANSVRYNATRDEVLVSVRNLNEFWIISRKTNIIVYRWGNPLNYQSGTQSTQRLFGQHDARWLDAEGTRISVFNNGQARYNTTPRDYSTVEELVIPVNADGTYTRESGKAFGPDGPVFIYPKVGTSAFFAINVSGATRQPNGNTLACLGPQGVMIEVTGDGEEVWRYNNPVGSTGIARQGQQPRNAMIFKIYRYGPEYPAFTGRMLKTQGKLEDGPLDVHEAIDVKSTAVHLDIFSREAQLDVFIPGRYRVDAFDLVGRWLGTVIDEELSTGRHIWSVPSGTFLLRTL